MKRFFIILCISNLSFANLHFEKPVLIEPQCDRFNEPICITYPKEGEIFTTNSCLFKCPICFCYNGFACNQRVLRKLTIKGTTMLPDQTVTVILSNTKVPTLYGFTLERVTKSRPAPDGTGVWSVTFGWVPTPRPPPLKQKDNIPTIISATVNSDWNTNYAIRTIFIKKDKNCKKDCDIVCLEPLFY